MAHKQTSAKGNTANSVTETDRQRAGVISNEFRNLCQERGLSIAEVAAAAGVSVQIPVRLRRAEKLAERLARARDSRRQRKALARALVQMARVLGKEPLEDWIEKAGIEFSAEQLSQIIQAAERSSRRSTQSVSGRPVDGVTDVVIREADRSGGEMIIDGVEIDFPPFASRDDDGRSWTRGLALQLVRSVHPRCDIRWTTTPKYLDVLHLSGDYAKRRPSVVVGFLQAAHREYGGSAWRFETIPGFRVRLAFLAEKKFATGKIKLPLLLAGRSKQPFQFVTLTESVADGLLSGPCCFGPGLKHNSNRLPVGWDLVRLDVDNYDRVKIEKEVKSRLDVRTGPRPIFVFDEPLADRIRQSLGEDRFVDLARPSISPDREGLEVPSFAPEYPIGVMMLQEDAKFRDAIRQIIRGELFDAHGAVVSGVFADYLASTLKGTELYARKVTQFFGTESTRVPALPSYLRISDAFPLPVRFLISLREQLAQRIGDAWRVKRLGNKIRLLVKQMVRIPTPF